MGTIVHWSPHCKYIYLKLCGIGYNWYNRQIFTKLNAGNNGVPAKPEEKLSARVVGTESGMDEGKGDKVTIREDKHLPCLLGKLHNIAFLWLDLAIEENKL